MKTWLGLLGVCVLAAASADDPPALSEALQAEVDGVRGDPTVRCEVQKKGVRCRPKTYRFLLARLPLAAKALRALKVDADYAIEDLEQPGTFSIDDKAGAYATCEAPIQEEGEHLVIARGHVDLPLVPRVLGTGVIDVRYRPRDDDPQRLRVRCSVAFRLTNRALHRVTRAFRRLLSRVIQGKLEKLIGAATTLAERVDADPQKVYRALQAGGEASEAELSAYRRAFLMH